MLTLFALLWGRVQGWLAAAGAVLAALVAAYAAGRRTGAQSTVARAAARAQEMRDAGDAAARSAERDGAAARLRAGRF